MVAAIKSECLAAMRWNPHSRPWKLATKPVPNTVLFAGHATVAMAREVYGIANPQERQLRLV